jgi:hypothetical protein
MNDDSPLRARTAVGTLPSMPPAKRGPDVSWLPVLLPNVQALLDQGEATRGCTATVRGGHIIVGRVDAAGADPRFRMTLLKGDAYGLSLYPPQEVGPTPLPGHRHRIGPGHEHRARTLGHRLVNARSIGPTTFEIGHLVVSDGNFES